jgi:serine/threonine protein kinase
MAARQISTKLDARASASAAGECLSDEEVLAFASGTLAPARQLAAHDHLDQCEICQHLLSEAAHALATAVTIPFLESEELSWHTTFRPGSVVGGRYLIRHFIARGGMGEVYEAFDRDLQERVALKTVTSTACDSPSAVRRLKAEVQLARRVSHPNVCRIYDFGTHVMPETGGQISFLTMEYVDGETLGQRIRLTGALPVEEARAIARQLLRGLSAAHDAGVLHRDFKSDNVILREEAGGGCSALILDFGLARALDEGSRNHSSSTPNLLGTFGYIAPEQLQGRPHTTASDVYSFGIVCFEMLTGELPFHPETESEFSPIASALLRLQAPAPTPSSKNPLVPRYLDAIVQACLRRSPKDRLRTAGEVLSALDSLENRARGSFQKRRLLPLSVAAVLGASAAYVAAIPSNRRPVAPVAEVAMHANVPSAPELRGPRAAPDISVSPQPSAVAPGSSAEPRRRPMPPPVARPTSPKAPDAIAPKAGPEGEAPAAEHHPPQGAAPPPKVPRWEDPFDAGTAGTTEPIADAGS